MQEHHKLNRQVSALLLALSIPFLYLLSRYSYNLFHSLADGLTIVIAACAFVVVWNSRHNIDNNYFTYVGISLLFFAFLDLIHMLGNKNMGVFPGYGNLGPTFYIAGRYLLSISLVVAPLFINRRLNTSLMIAIYSLATSLILLSVFYWNVFPACIIEGVGLTPFKVISDYVICLILLGAIGLLLVNRRSFDPRVLRTLVFSIALSLATGLTFTLYTDPFGVTNMVGHLFQISSFYLVYVAIIETSLTKPQETLFRKLKQNEEKLAETNTELQQEITERRQTEEALRKARDELEARVEERTKELRTAYERLKEETHERTQAEHQLRQAQKLEALGTLAGGIAHDFNNILAAIIGFTELARDRLPKENRERRHIDRVFQAGMRGRELVKQMLTFSRQAEQEKKPLRLSGIVKETAKLLRASIPATISIKTTVKSESGVIFGDPVQIQQVLMNLATNAAHAMQEKGGVLNIELSDLSVGHTDGNSHGIAPGLYMKLVVRDTGVGIAPGIIDKIFDPFFTTKKLGEGTGLGLSVVMGIVKQSGGYITAESEPGKGSTFIVYFPKVEEKPRTEETDYEDVPTGHERILFVDDEEALVEMGEDILAELGYEVICRTSSREALALFRLDPSRFDLVLTDQTMPEMTGVELAREMLLIRPDIPVILATGFSHVVNEESARAEGLGGYVMKPLTKREIAKTIRKVLDEEKTCADVLPMVKPSDIASHRP